MSEICLDTHCCLLLAASSVAPGWGSSGWEAPLWPSATLGHISRFRGDYPSRKCRCELAWVAGPKAGTDCKLPSFFFIHSQVQMNHVLLKSYEIKIYRKAN
ncbi:hypothetical protein ABZP36_034417 [Zizania latifolia]